MDKIKIGEVIFKMRKERGITQEQLSFFVGVSTAAVSKWESGVSYPDITFLPVLASFFNISIDELLNYKTELSKEEVMSLYKKCELLFSGDEVDKALELSRQYVDKYPNSYFLKMRIAFLFQVYSFKKGSEEGIEEMLKKSVSLLEDIANNCNDQKLVEEALFCLGAEYSSLGEQDKAIEVLGKIKKSELNPDQLLANIYIRKGEFKKARKMLQSRLFQNIWMLSLICSSLSDSYYEESKDLSMVEKYLDLAINIKKAFMPEGRKALNLYHNYLLYAGVYMKFGEKEKAINMLNNMLEDIGEDDINKYPEFQSVWCFNEMEKNQSETITLNLFDTILITLEDERFNPIKENEDFLKVVNRVKELKENSLKKNM
jgi:transcriptional regulator with XRE-family HTH domain